MIKPRIRRFLSAAFAGWLAVTAAPASAVDATKPDPLGDARKQIAELFDSPDAKKPFETASVRYVPGPDRAVVQTPCYRLVDDQGRRIELTGVIHIGEKAYYEALDKHLGTFDAVLFELVGDASKVKSLQTTPAPGDGRGKESDLSQLYRVLAHDLLSMSMQMDVINYRRPNFIHADLNESELNALLKAKGLTLDELITSQQQASGFKLSIAQMAKLIPLFKFFVPKDDPAALARMMAPQFAKLESGDGKMTGVHYEILIVRRNARALEVLDRELAGGKKNLSLFYGSAHLPDFKKRLNERGWKDAGVEWRDAWVIPAKSGAAAAPAPATPPAGEETAREDATANALLATVFRPFAIAKATRFKFQLAVKSEVLGQKINQEASAEVTAMKPNLLVLHLKGTSGKEGTLVSDGKTVTLHAKGATTYRQLPAPATFAEFAAIPGLAEIGFEENNNVFPYLSLDGEASLASAGFTGARRLESAQLDRQPHDRLELSVLGNQVVLWYRKDAAFPLVKMEVDTAKLVEQQLGALGKEAAALKELIKMEAGMTFSEGAVAETFPAETFRFNPPPGATKE